MGREGRSRRRRSRRRKSELLFGPCVYDVEGDGTDEISGDEAEDGKYQWWEDAENDGSTKWKTLVHNGVLFPPAYIPLPKGVKMRYDGECRCSSNLGHGTDSGQEGSVGRQENVAERVVPF